MTAEVSHRRIRLHGHEVAYRIGGEVDDGRPVLLLVHGMAGSASTWRQVMPALARNYTVIAPDLLGHGASAKPRHDYSLGSFASSLRDLLAALDVERATVVGHSLGGGVAMQFAYQHPESCERLALVGSGGLGPDVALVLRALSLPGSELLMPLLFPGFARNVGDQVNRWLTGVGIRAPLIAEEWRSYASLTDPETRQAFVRTLRSVVDPGGQAVSAVDRLYLAEHLPVLIVWGRRDRIIPVSHGLSAHEALPNSRFEVFDHTGHFPHAEDPMRFVEVLSEFLEGTEAMHLDDATWRELVASRA